MAIIKGRPQQSFRPLGKQLRINDQIRLSPVRLIDDNDQQVGIIELLEAKRRAREAGLDLVEVAGNAVPPVCRIMDYGKWKYQQKKKEQKARSHAKTSELKGIRLRPNTDDHDLNFKIETARTFLNDGDKVQFTLIFKGREMAHRDIGLATLHRIRTELTTISRVEAEPKMMGRRMTMVLVPDRKTVKPAGATPAGPGATPASPRPTAGTPAPTAPPRPAPAVTASRSSP